MEQDENNEKHENEHTEESVVTKILSKGIIETLADLRYSLSINIDNSYIVAHYCEKCSSVYTNEDYYAGCSRKHFIIYTFHDTNGDIYDIKYLRYCATENDFVNIKIAKSLPKEEKYTNFCNTQLLEPFRGNWYLPNIKNIYNEYKTNYGKCIEYCFGLVIKFDNSNKIIDMSRSENAKFMHFIKYIKYYDNNKNCVEISAVWNYDTVVSVRYKDINNDVIMKKSGIYSL